MAVCSCHWTGLLPSFVSLLGSQKLEARSKLFCFSWFLCVAKYLRDSTISEHTIACSKYWKMPSILSEIFRFDNNKYRNCALYDRLFEVEFGFGDAVIIEFLE